MVKSIAIRCLDGGCLVILSYAAAFVCHANRDAGPIAYTAKKIFIQWK